MSTVRKACATVHHRVNFVVGVHQVAAMQGIDSGMELPEGKRHSILDIDRWIRDRYAEEFDEAALGEGQYRVAP